MGIYIWIQEHLFHTYYTWRLRSPISNRSGFHIVGITNSLQAMRNGVIGFMELYPQRPIDGCTMMKAVWGASEDCVDMYIEIDGVSYKKSDVSYNDAS